MLDSLLNLPFDSATLAVLEEALLSVREYLTNFAKDPAFNQKLELAFGENIDAEAAQELANAWQNGDFTAIPTFEAIDAFKFNGAFAVTSDRIYLSATYVSLMAAWGEIEVLVSLLLEEIGHKIDTLLNSKEAIGDEGAIFSALARGKILGDRDLSILKAEDDRAIIISNGRVIEIEQQNFLEDNNNNDITGTSEDDVIESKQGQDNVNGGEGNDLLIIDYSSNTYRGANAGIVSSVGKHGEGNFYYGNYRAYRDDFNYDFVNFSYIERFQITGTIADDDIKTCAGNDRVIGGDGNDILTTDDGKDFLLGISPNNLNLGWGEVDVLEGGNGADLYVLGNGLTSFYDDRDSTKSGLNDYAKIIGFAPDEDRLQINGLISNYRLDTSPIVGINGTALYLKKNTSELDELIAIFEEVSEFALNSELVIEDLPSPGILSFTSSQFSIKEDGTSVVEIGIIRTRGNDGNVSAIIQLTDASAEAEKDYNSAPILVDFSDGETLKIIDIPIISDGQLELDESLYLTLINPTGGATIGSQNSAKLTIIDSDKPIITGLPNGAYGSNLGQITIAIAGQNFTRDSQISLIAEDGSKSLASQVIWQDANQLWATFDLVGLNTGIYDLELATSLSNFILDNSFTVTSGAIGTLELNISYDPVDFNSLGPRTATITYTNIGETNLTAPVLKVTGTNLDFSNDREEIADLYLGISQDGIPGILLPRQSGSISFSYLTEGNGLISLDVEEVKTNEIIDWQKFKQNYKPENISNEAWEAIWQNLIAEVGVTAADFQSKMLENANYLNQFGNIKSNSNLLDFELKKANNNLQNSQLISLTDIVDFAARINLTINRTFFESIDRRYRVGDFGRGWTHQWDIKAEFDSHYIDKLGYFPLKKIIIYSNLDAEQTFYINESPYFNFDPTGGSSNILRDVVSYVSDDGSTLDYFTQTDNLQIKQTNGAIASFSNNGKLAYLQDNNNNRIDFAYNLNNLSSLTHSNGSKLNITYNVQDTIAEIINSTGEKVNYTYDPTGEYLLSVTNSQGTTNYTYDTSNIAPKKYSLLSISADRGYQRNFAYDDRGRLIKTFSNNGLESLSYSYHAGEIAIADSSGAKGSWL
jgi:hypothetical protein